MLYKWNYSGICCERERERERKKDICLSLNSYYTLFRPPTASHTQWTRLTSTQCYAATFFPSWLTLWGIIGRNKFLNSSDKAASHLNDIQDGDQLPRLLHRHPVGRTQERILQPRVLLLGPFGDDSRDGQDHDLWSWSSRSQLVISIFWVIEINFKLILIFGWSLIFDLQFSRSLLYPTLTCKLWVIWWIKHCRILY